MTEKCTMCGNILIPRFPTVLDPITDKNFSIHICPECGLGHTIPQPHDLNVHYGAVYYGNRHGFTSRYCTRRRLGFVAAVIKEQAGKRLLDIGCGDGSFLLAARNAGWEVVGTEMNPHRASLGDLDVKKDITEVPEDRPFDCITMWHTLEHMRDIRTVLSQISRLLKPEGKLLIAVPDNGGFQARLFKQKWLHLDVPRHLFHFDAGSLSFCLKQAGFRVHQQWHQELEYDLLGWSQSVLNCLRSTPNVFFNQLTGKEQVTLLKIPGFAFGSILTLLALPAVAAGRLFGRGGTIIFACRVA